MASGSAFCFVVTFSLFSLSFANGDSLRLVQLIYRHGDRNPVKTFPNDAVKEDAWPQGYGQLTKLGIQQTFELGQFLRQRYMHNYSTLLNETYINDQIYVLSSDSDRCLMSASSKLAGMYPPQGQQVWNPSVTWQPIPVHTRRHNDDEELDMELSSEICPRYIRLYNAVLNSQEVLETLSKDKEFFQNISKLAGFDHIDIQKLRDLTDTLMVEKIHNKTWPAWVTPKVFDKLYRFNMMKYKIWHYTPEMTRIRAGLLLSDILNHTDEVTSGQTQKKLLSYSTHDSTLGAFAFALKIWENVMPSYASCYMVELHEPSPKNFTIKVFYRNDTMRPPYLFTIPGCTAECPLSTFRQLVQGSVLTSPQDWFKACEDSPPKQKHHSLVVVLSIIAVIVVFVAIVIVIVCYRRRTSGINYMPANFNSVKS